jgi:hypothetical protein
MAIRISISDKATPAIRGLKAKLRSRIAPEIGDAVARLFKAHFVRLPSNKNNWPTTDFWKRAAGVTNYEVRGANVAINVPQEGVLQRRFGGPISAKSGKWLTIPACAEAYGKRARDFSNLRFVSKLGALVQKTSTPGTRGENDGDVVMYWLRKSVYQKSDERVIPSDRQIRSAALDALNRIVDQANKRGGGA